MTKNEKAPEVGKVTKLDDGRDMTLVDYEKDDDGDTFTWIIELWNLRRTSQRRRSTGLSRMTLGVISILTGIALAVYSDVHA